MTSTPSLAFKQVFHNDYYTLFVDERLCLVRLVRSEKPFASVPEFEACIAKFLPELAKLESPRYVILSDVRAVPGRNDPAFEAASARLLPRWLSGFRKVAVLVQSTVGQLQVQRYTRKEGVVRRVSTDEAELLAYLLGPEE